MTPVDVICCMSTRQVLRRGPLQPTLALLRQWVGASLPAGPPTHPACRPVRPTRPSAFSVRFLCSAEAMPFELFENIQTNQVRYC